MKLRRALAVVLCLLLLSLQSQALVHPLSHLAKRGPQDAGVAASTIDKPCAQCAVLAGASAAAVGHDAAFQCERISQALAVPSRSSRAADAPAWSRSRAPPPVLA